MSIVELDNGGSTAPMESIEPLDVSTEAINNISQTSSGEASRSTSSLTTTTTTTTATNTAVTFPEGTELVMESEGSFTWQIESFSTRESGKLYSPQFKVGPHSWRVLLYPRGNEPVVNQHLSLYVALDPPDNASNDWAVCAQVILTVEHPTRPELSTSKYTQHRFDANEADWGFSSFLPLKMLMTGEAPFVGPDDTLTVSARIRVIRDETGVLWHNFINYNSKRVTGHVGLANQGATCYMNSLLQSLYFTSVFRQIIYGIPTDGEVPTDSSVLALQRIFWRLQFADTPVSTAELTTAFGWDTMEAFIQSDVQEFSRVLMDDLERRAKGTAVEGDLERLFVGKVRNVIRCMNVPFQSTRTESFYDLQLTIKGMHTLQESFDNYVKAEMLEGDNKYHAEGHGLQDARRFVEFETFPPVLHMHLERYAFDPHVMGTVKINDRLEFPRRINLDRYLAPDSPQQGQSQEFLLHAVFVHSGDSHGGHYYVYICDDPRKEEPRWLRFDDTKVVPATAKEAIEDNFGGEENNDDGHPPADTMITRSALRTREKYRRCFTNGYMLVYIRESDADRILAEIQESDIPPHIGTNIRTEDEAAAARRLEKQQQLMTVRAHILTDAALGEYGGFDLYNFDNRNLPASDGVTTVRVRRDEPLKVLKTQIASQLNQPEERLRFWTFACRRNKTVRLDEPVAREDEEKTIAHFVSRLTHHHPHFVLYAEVLSPGTTEFQSKDMKVIFFKFYDPEHATLKPVGKLYVKPSDTLESHYPALREMIGLPSRSTATLAFYEEVKPSRVDPIVSNKTFEGNQLVTGDIICFQLANPILDPALRMPKATDYYRLLNNRVFVEFRDAEGKILTALRIDIDTLYGDILKELSTTLQASPTHIRLFVVDEAGEMTPLKGIPANSTLIEALKSVPLGNAADTEGVILACEVTSMPVADLDAMKQIHLSLVTNLLTESPAAECPVHIGLKDTVSTLFARLPESFRSNLRQPVRLVETHNNRVIRDYIDEDSLSSLGESSAVYIESADAADLDPPPGHVIISVFSFASKDPTRTHGRPFRFLLRPGEPFHLTRQRLIARMGADPSVADKWNFSVVSYGRARTINDDDILVGAGSGPASQDQIGIGRPDPAVVRPATPSGERAIKIRSSVKP